MINKDKYIRDWHNCYMWDQQAFMTVIEGMKTNLAANNAR